MTTETTTYTEQLKNKIKSCESVIAVIGLGYVGLPLAKGFASQGFKVNGIEQNPAKVETLKKGTDYIDPSLGDLKPLLERLNPTTDFSTIGQSDVLVICVPTPLTKNLEPDISYVRSVSVEIGKYIKPGSLVILESTTYPGTTDEVVRKAVESGGRVHEAGKDYFLAFSPERVDPGNPHYNTSNTTKVLGGTTKDCSDVTAMIYEKLLGSPDLVKVASSTRAAEMEKLFENIFRSVNIALVNELSLICRAMDLDVWEIIELASTKPYGFMPFFPGPGIGGHCIPLDPFYLSWKAREFDIRTRFIELAAELNSSMPSHVMELTAEALGEKGIRGANVLIVGVAYKPNISDYRESPSLKIMERLLARGAKISYLDPHVPSVKLSNNAIFEPVENPAPNTYDVCILLTIHDIVDLSQVCKAAPKTVDTRGATRHLDLDSEVTVLGSGPVHKPS